MIMDTTIINVIASEDSILGIVPTLSHIYPFNIVFQYLLFDHYILQNMMQKNPHYTLKSKDYNKVLHNFLVQKDMS
jgi:hypothetical protein